MKRDTARKLKKISGYLEPGDAAIVRKLLVEQTREGLSGPVAEIGVHHGKLILTMASELQASERAVAIDIFGNQEENVDKSGKGDLEIFVHHAKQLGLLPRLDIIKGNSTLLRPSDLARFSEAKFRMFSVDGGHTYDVVSSDMKLAADTLCDGGIILADDYFNYGWPDVSYAIAAFVRDDTNPIFPFAASSSKLYLTNNRTWARFYREVLATSPYPSLEKAQKMGGDEVHVFDTRSFGSTSFTFARMLKSRIRGSKIARASDASHATPSLGGTLSLTAE
jgi:hypothetical protein